MGLMAVIPALPLYIEERFGLTDPAEVRQWTALAFGAAPFSAALCGPLWGLLGDRVGRKAMVVRAQLGVGVALALMPLASDPATLTALRVLQGLFAGYIAPAMALVSVDVPREYQGRILARLQLALALGLTIGPPAGAEMAAWFGRGTVFWMSSGLAFASVVPVALLVREDRSTLTSPRAPREGGGSDDRALARYGPIVALLALIFMLRFGTQMVEPFNALWVRELGPLQWLADGARAEFAVDRTTALVFTILAVGQLIATPWWGRRADRLGPLRSLVWVSLALAVILALASQVGTIEQYLGLRCVAALFLAGTTTLAYASVSRRIDPSRRSLAFSLVQSCMQLGLALGPLCGSVVAATAGLRGGFAVASGVLACTALGMWILRRYSPPTF